MQPPAGLQKTTAEESKAAFAINPRRSLREVVNTPTFPLTPLADHPPCIFQCTGCPFCRCALSSLAQSVERYEGPLTDTEYPEYGSYVRAVTCWIEGSRDVNERECRKRGHWIYREFRHYGPSWPNQWAYQQECEHDGYRLVVRCNPDYSMTRHQIGGPEGTSKHTTPLKEENRVLIDGARKQWEEIRRVAIEKRTEACDVFALIIAESRRIQHQAQETSTGTSALDRANHAQIDRDVELVKDVLRKDDKYKYIIEQDAARGDAKPDTNEKDTDNKEAGLLDEIEKKKVPAEDAAKEDTPVRDATLEGACTGSVYKKKKKSKKKRSKRA